jgi:hypothetical protein
MFDSVQSAFLPIGILAALAGVLLAPWSKRWLATLSAVALAVGISCAWWWLPQLLWPQEHTDPQGGWGLVAVFVWSLLAVPVALAALFIAGRLRARRARDAA